MKKNKKLSTKYKYWIRSSGQKQWKIIIDRFWCAWSHDWGRKRANMKWDFVYCAIAPQSSLPNAIIGVNSHHNAEYFFKPFCLIKLICSTLRVIDKTNIWPQRFPNVISNLISLLTVSISPFNNFPPVLWLWDTLFHFYNALVVTIWQNFLDKLDHFEGRFEKENVSTKEDWPFTPKKRFFFSIIKLIYPPQSALISYVLFSRTEKARNVLR